MKKENMWIIIDIRTRKALYGAGSRLLRFSTEEVAKEVAEQLFEKTSAYIICHIERDLLLFDK